ncbi:MAG: response regulator [Acetobacteraceae bacterium]|nr:response regulator [Acetobacteraceae bacterium]
MTGPRFNRCLLLVEDDALVRDTVALMLEDEGYEVIEASDARTALELVRAGLDAPVIVTDVDLRTGPSGAELADAVHRMRPDLRIILITGRPPSLAGRECDEREAILPKPFASEALSRLVREMSARR